MLYIRYRLTRPVIAEYINRLERSQKVSQWESAGESIIHKPKSACTASLLSHCTQEQESLLGQWKFCVRFLPICYQCETDNTGYERD